MSAGSSRAAFEAWWKSILRLPHEDKHSAFMGWQASRKQALESAEDRVTTLYEGEDLPFLVDICKAIWEN